MACGEPFNEYAMIAAHRTLPLGTEVKVTNIRNGRSVVVRIMDRGPHIAGRTIDLSKAAADHYDSSIKVWLRSEYKCLARQEPNGGRRNLLDAPQ